MNNFAVSSPFAVSGLSAGEVQLAQLDQKMDPKVKEALDKVRDNVNPASPSKPANKPVKKPPVDPAAPAKKTGAPSSAKPAAGGKDRRVEWRQTLEREVKASGLGARNLQDLLTNTAYNPAKNLKAAALWKRLSDVALKVSNGKYGTTPAGRPGSSGTVLTLLDAKPQPNGAKPANPAGVFVYSVLGATASFNILQATGMTRNEAVWQLPAGFGRDIVNVGLSKLPIEAEHPMLDVVLKGTTGAAMTLLTNYGAYKINKKAEIHPGLNVGMVLTSFTVTGALKSVKEMQKANMLGGLPADQPKNWPEWVHKYFTESAAIGAGVTAGMTPGVMLKAKWSGVPLSRGAILNTIGATFLMPLAQNLVANIIVNPPRAATPRSQAPAESNHGKPALAAINNKEAYLTGANAFQRADDTRNSNNEYVNNGDPVAAIAGGVLKLQDLIGQQKEINVRSNAEAAAVVEKALDKRQDGSLSPAAEAALQPLLRSLGQYGVYFDSSRVKAVATIAATQPRADANGALRSAPKIPASDQAFVREVFQGSVQSRDIATTDNVQTVLESLAVLPSFLGKRVLGAAAGVAVSVLDAQPTAKRDMVLNSVVGFQERMQVEHGGTMKAFGLSAGLPKNITIGQSALLEEVATGYLYRELGNMARNHKGSAKNVGPPPQSAHSYAGGYYYSIFKNLTPAERREIGTRLRAVVQGMASITSKRT